MAQLPSPGGDITNIAQTAPGAVLNNTGGYGNFTVNGLPATSNLFTVNGENDMDPYFNINNTGATNLTIGSGEIQEATVVANAYSGEYGQLSGAQVTYVTKSGTNAFHGDGPVLVERSDHERQRLDEQQLGCPAGLSRTRTSGWPRWAVPSSRTRHSSSSIPRVCASFCRTSINTTIPTPAFATATLANVQALQPAEYPLYQKMFQSVCRRTRARAARKPIPNNAACNALNLPGFDPSDAELCAAAFQPPQPLLARSGFWLSRSTRTSGRMTSCSGAISRTTVCSPPIWIPSAPTSTRCRTSPRGTCSSRKRTSSLPNIDQRVHGGR